MTLVCSSRCLFSFPSFCEQDLASLNSLDDNTSYHACDCLYSASFFAQFVLLLLFSSKQSLKSFSPKLLGKVKMPTRYTTFTLTRFHLNQQIVPFSSPLDVYKAHNTLKIQFDFFPYANGTRCNGICRGPQLQFSQSINIYFIPHCNLSCVKRIFLLLLLGCSVP